MLEQLKDTLVRHLDVAGDALIWKLEGLSEYDVRRPLTPTGTNLLGMIKHCAWVEAGYFGFVFDRPFPESAPWDWDDPATDANVDWVATEDESRDDLLALYGRVREWAGETIRQRDLGAPGHVAWWGDRAEVTLHQVMVHLVAELNRHAGQADILREGIDGVAGVRRERTGLPGEGYDWGAHVARVEAAAQSFA